MNNGSMQVKLCGMSRPVDIEAVNEIKPDYIGFIFARKSKRYVDPVKAAELKSMLNDDIKAVGVFVNEDIETVAGLINNKTIDIPQLHGQEDEEYISTLRTMIDAPIIKAFRIDSAEDAHRANSSSADMVLLDSGAGGTGTSFDWSLLKEVRRPYILAGGLYPENVQEGLKALNAEGILKPLGVDVSSGIETDGVKDKQKMIVFTRQVRDYKESENDK